MRLKGLAGALAIAGVLVTTMGVTSAAADDQELAKSQIFPEVQITGAGATFPCNYIEQARADAANQGLKVTYQCIGSGGGRSAFIEGTVDFAGSDVPLTGAEQSQLASTPVRAVRVRRRRDRDRVQPRLGHPEQHQAERRQRSARSSAARSSSGTTRSSRARTRACRCRTSKLRVAVRSDSSGTSNWFTNVHVPDLAVVAGRHAGRLQLAAVARGSPACSPCRQRRRRERSARQPRHDRLYRAQLRSGAQAQRRRGRSAGMASSFPRRARSPSAIAGLSLNSDGSVTPSFNDRTRLPASRSSPTCSCVRTTRTRRRPRTSARSLVCCSRTTTKAVVPRLRAAPAEPD